MWPSLLTIVQCHIKKLFFFAKQCFIFRASLPLPCYEFLRKCMRYSTHLQSSVETGVKCALVFSIVRLLRYIPYMFFFTSCLKFLWIYFQLNCRRSVNSCLKKLAETHINVHRHKIYYSSNILEHKVIISLLRVVSHLRFALKIRSPASVKSRLLFYKKCVYTFRYYIHQQWMLLVPTPDLPPCRLLWPTGW